MNRRTVARSADHVTRIFDPERRVRTMLAALAFLFALGAGAWGQSPTIIGGSVAAGNVSVTVNFSEGVYSNTGGVGNLTAGDFNLTFAQNGGNATGASISGVTHTAGQTLATLGLTITGTPSGAETINITPLDGTSIYDTDSNPVAVTENTGNLALHDQLAPSGYTVAIDQAYINQANRTAISFTFGAAEVGTTYNYSFTSTGGGTPVTGSGTIATATDQITGMNLNGLGDGTVTLSVTLTDAAGNTGGAVTSARTKDVVAPSGYTVAIDQAYINQANRTAISFTFGAAEVGTTYNYSFTSTGGGTPVTGSGTIATATDQITGMNLNGLGDGTVTLSVTLTDAAGNTGGAVTSARTKDVVAPSGYTVAIDQAYINQANRTAISFTFGAAEVGTTYNYSFTSTGGGTPVTGSGTIATATDQITGMNLNGLGDGTVTLSVTLTDAAGNAGGAVTSARTKDVVAPTISPVTIASNNAVAGRGSAYATQNNTVTVSFTTSETVSVSAATIDSGAATVSGATTSWSAARTFDGSALTSGGNVGFSITVSDAAGNSAMATVITSGANVIRYNTMTASGTGNAEVIGTWSPGAAPAANDILTVTGTGVITQGQDIECFRLTNAGTWDTAGHALTVYNTFANPGTISHNGTGTMTLTFDASQGTVTLSGGTGFPFGNSYYGLTISGGAHVASANLTVGGNLVISGGSLDLVANQLAVTGTTNNAGTITLGGTGGLVGSFTGAVTNTGTIILGGGNVTFANLVTNTGGIVTGGSGTITLSGGLAGGTLTASSGNTVLSGAGASLTAGTFNANGGTLRVNGTGAQSVNAYILANLVINKTNGAATIAGVTSATSVTVTNSLGTVFSGAVTATTVTLTATTGTIDFQSSVDIGTLNTTTAAYALTFGGGGTIGGGPNFQNGGLLTLGGPLALPGGATRTSGNLTLSGGSVSTGGANALNFGTAGTISASGTVTLGGAVGSTGLITLGAVGIGSGGTLALGNGQQNSFTVGAITGVGVGNLTYNSANTAASTIASYNPTGASALTVTNVGAGGLTFNGTVGATTALSGVTIATGITSGGAVTFNGALSTGGMTAPSGTYALSISGGGTIGGGPNFQNGGLLTLGGPLALPGGATRTSGNLTLSGGSVSTGGANALNFGTAGTISASGTVTLGGAVGSTGLITLGAVGIGSGGTLALGNGQQNSFTVGAITGAGVGNLTYNSANTAASTIASYNPTGASALTVTNVGAGGLTFNGTVGATTTLTGVTIATGITSGGAVTFNGALSTGGMTAPSGTYALSISGGGTIGGGPNFQNGGLLTLGGPLALPGGATRTSGNLTLSGGSVSTGGANALNFGTAGTISASGTVTLGGAVGSTGLITLGAVGIGSGGTLALGNGQQNSFTVGAITGVGVGNLTYNSANTAASTIASYNPTGASALTVTNVGAGGLTFNGTVGATTALSGVTIATGITSGGAVTFNGALSTGGMTAPSGTYALSISGGGTIGGGPNFQNGGLLTLGGPLALPGGATRTSGNLTLSGGSVSTGGANALNFGTAGTISASGTVTLGGAVGSTGLITLGAVGIGSGGTLALGNGQQNSFTVGAITGAGVGNLTYNSANTAASTIASYNPTGASALTVTNVGAGGLTFNGTVGATTALTGVTIATGITSGGAVTFNGALSTGGMTAPSGTYALSISGGGTIGGGPNFQNGGLLTLGGPLALPGGATRTSGNLTLSGGSVSTGGANALNFGTAGTISASGTVTLGGAVGSTGLITLGAVGIGSGGTLALGNGQQNSFTVGAITGAGVGNLTYNSANTAASTIASYNPTGASALTVTNVGAGGLTFNGTVGATTALTGVTIATGITSGGAVTFNGALSTGGMTAPSGTYALSISGGGTIGGGPNFQNGGLLTLGGPLALPGGATRTSGNLTLSGGSVSTGGANALNFGTAGTISASGTVTLGGAVGSTGLITLGAVGIGSGGTLALGNGQQNSFTVGAITGAGVGNLTYNSANTAASTIASYNPTGASALTVTNVGAGGLTFNGTVGATTTLTGVVFGSGITSAGTVTFSGALYASGMTVNNAPTYAYNIVLNGGGTIGGNPTFSNGGTLTIGASITFTAGVTAIAPSVVYLTGTISATGAALNFGDANGVTLNGATILSPGGGTATLGGTVTGGGYALTVNSASATSSFGGVVSGLSSLTINTGAAFAANGNVTVAGPLVLTSGTLSMAANALYVSGNITQAGGGASFNGAGILYLNGNDQDIDLSTSSIRSLSLSASAAATVVTANGSFAVGGNLDVYQYRTLAMGAYNLSVTGMTNNTAGNYGAITSVAGTQFFSDTFTINNLTTSSVSSTFAGATVILNTLTPNGGTAYFTGTTALTCNGVAFNNLQVSSGTLTPQDTLTVNASFTLLLGANYVNNSRTLAFASASAGTIRDNNGTKVNLGAVTIAAGVKSLGTALAMTSLAVNSGSLALGNYNLALTGSVSIAGGTLTHGTGTLSAVGLSLTSGAYTGTGTGNLTLSGAYNQSGGTAFLGNKTISAATMSVSTSGATSLALDSASISLSSAPNSIVATTLSDTASLITLNGAGNLTLDTVASHSIGNLFVDADTSLLSSHATAAVKSFTVDTGRIFAAGANDFRCSGAVVLDGSYTESTGSLFVAGNLTVNAGTGSLVSSGTGALVFVGGNAQLFTTGGKTFGPVTVAKTAGIVAQSSGSFTASAFTITSGTFTLNTDDTLTLTGPASLNGGILNLNGLLSASGQTFGVEGCAVYVSTRAFVTGDMTVNSGSFRQSGENSGANTVASLSVSGSGTLCEWDYIGTSPGGSLTIQGHLAVTLGGVCSFYNKNVTIGGSVTGDLTFLDLRIPSGKTITMAVGSSMTVLRNMTIDLGGKYVHSNQSLYLGGGGITTGIITDSNLPVNRQNLGAVTILPASAILGAVKTFSTAIAAVSISSDVLVTLTVSGGSVTTDTLQTYDGPVVLGADAVFNGTALTFNGAVSGDYDLTINCPVTISADIDTATTGIQTYNDTVTVGSAAPILTSASIIFASSLALGANSLGFGGGNVSFNAGMTAGAGYLRFLGGGSISASASARAAMLPAIDVYIDAPANTVTLATDFSCRRVIFYCGAFNLDSHTLTTAGDFAAFGSDYNPVDIDWMNSGNTRFAYYPASSLSYYPAGGTYSAGAFSTSPTAIFSNLDGATIAVGGNFYVNGVNLPGTASWTLSIPDNSASNPVYNAGNAVTLGQWGSPYAVVLNATVAYCGATHYVNAAQAIATAPAEHNNGAVDGGNNNSYLVFQRPQINVAQTIYDDVLMVSFVDATGATAMSISNASHEIWNIVNAVTASVSAGGIWYNGAALQFLGAYADVACTTSLLASSADLSEFYLRVIPSGTNYTDATAAHRWNTDATGASAGAATSRDRGRDSGSDETNPRPANRSTIPNLSFAKGTLYAANGKTMVRAYGLSSFGGVSYPTYTGTEDDCRPIVVAVRTGQEQHTAPGSGQSYTDAHNYFEIDWSEPVTIGNLAANASNIRSDLAFASAAQHGGDYTASGGVATLGGYFTLGDETFTISRGSGSDTSSTWNALYRSGSTPFRLRVYIAGFATGSDPNITWPGWIENVRMPSGSVNVVANAYILDLASNAVEATADATAYEKAAIAIDSAEAPGQTYGIWDTFEPTLALVRDNTVPDWSDDFKAYGEVMPLDVDGNTRIDRMEFHFIDNGTFPLTSPPTEDDMSLRWASMRGWIFDDLAASYSNASSAFGLPDTRGGARPSRDNYTPPDPTVINPTAGGIRYSTLTTGASGSIHAFRFCDSRNGTYTDANNNLFESYVVSGLYNTSSINVNDDPYFTIILNEGAWNTASTMYFSYDKSGCVTDLAGNRLQSISFIPGVSLTPPKFRLSLSVADSDARRVYLQFDKDMQFGNLELKDDPTFASYFTFTGGASAITPVSATTISARELMLTVNRNLTAHDVFNVQIGVVENLIVDPFHPIVTDPLHFIRGSYVYDFVGNALKSSETHTLSDFGLNIINMSAATDGLHETDEPVLAAGETALPASALGALRSFDGSGNLLDRDITLYSLLNNSGSLADSYSLQCYYDVNPSSSYAPFVSVTDRSASLGTVWLPAVLSGFNLTAKELLRGTSPSMLRDFRIPGNDSEIAAGAAVGFLFSYGGKFCLRSSDPNDPRQFDLYRFGIKNVRQQRGGVTILNNVINPTTGERTALQVVLDKAGPMTATVFTLDGDVVKRLFNDRQAAGTYTYYWDGRNNAGLPVARGVYFIRVVAKGIDEIRKVLVVR